MKPKSFPIGKYKDTPIEDIPSDYLTWAVENIERADCRKIATAELERRGESAAPKPKPSPPRGGSGMPSHLPHPAPSDFIDVGEYTVRRDLILSVHAKSGTVMAKLPVFSGESVVEIDAEAAEMLATHLRGGEIPW